MASSSPRKTLSDPAAVFPQKSSDRLLDGPLPWYLTRSPEREDSMGVYWPMSWWMGKTLTPSWSSKGMRGFTRREIVAERTSILVYSTRLRRTLLVSGGVQKPQQCSLRREGLRRLGNWL